MNHKAEFSSIGRDLFWKIYDAQDGFIRWGGYDDDYWWNVVSPTMRDRTGPKTGRIFRINYQNNVVEIIE